MQKQFGSKVREPGIRHRPSVRALALACLTLACIGTVVVGSPSPASAQQAPGAFQDPEGLEVWETGGCSTCHNGFATGGRGGENPAGPNLRKTRLTRDEVRETVACGRGQMPSHLEGAYKTVACYGLDLGEVPEGQAIGHLMSAEDLDHLVNFLFTYVVNVPLTKEICAVYNDGNKDAPACAQFPE